MAAGLLRRLKQNVRRLHKWWLLTTSPRHHFPLSNRCLQPAFPIVFPTIPNCVSRPYTDYVPDRFPDYDMFPTMLPTVFPTMFPSLFPYVLPTDVPDLFPTRSTIPSCQEIVYSQPVPSTKSFPPSSPILAVSQRESFPILSLGKTHFFFRCGGQNGYRLVPRGAFGTARTLANFHICLIRQCAA